MPYRRRQSSHHTGQRSKWKRLGEISRPLAASNAIHLLTKNNIIKRRDGSECAGVFLEYNHHTKRKKMLRATQHEGETISPASLSRNQLHCSTVNPSPAQFPNNNNSIAPSYTPKILGFKKVPCHPSTDPSRQNVLAHASRSKRVVRACLIHS